jgi:UTP-glucose-1-phosphate uridylyltransferase
MMAKLLVLAAGMGSRFGGVKQVAAVGPAGESIIEYSVFDAVSAGFDEVIFLLRREIEDDFSRTVLSRLPKNLRRVLAWQDMESCVPPDCAGLLPGRTKPWGTGHALLCARKELEEGAPCAFAVINADDYYGREGLAAVRDFLATADPAGKDYCMAGYRLSRTTSPFGAVSRGVCATDESGYLRRIEEHLSIIREAPDSAPVPGEVFLSRLPGGATRSRFTGAEAVSMNLWGFTTAVLDDAEALFRDFLANLRSAPGEERGRKEFFLPGIVDALVGSGKARVKVLPVSESLFGLTYRQDLDESRRRIAALSDEGRYPVPLWSAS